MSLSKLNLEYFLSHIQQLPETEHYWLGFSGGVDSVVLLHLMSQLVSGNNQRLTATHINHNISPQADIWQQHCSKQCADYGISFKAINVNARKTGGESPEAFARQLRYEAFTSLLKKDEILLTAHHYSDQTETFLLQLFRGAGPDGLSSMPFIKPFGEGYLARPLLDFSKEQIIQYAETNKLKWIHDHSNDDRAFDRNFIRHEILPAIKRRWPSVDKTINRVIHHQSMMKKLSEEYACNDLQLVLHPTVNALDIDKLKRFSRIRQVNIIRAWLRKDSFLMPTADNMEHIFTDVLDCKADKNPLIEWQGCQVRRFRNWLFSMTPLKTMTLDLSISFPLGKKIQLETGVLKANLEKGPGLKPELVNDNVEIRFRRGGEKIKFSGRDYTQELKKVFQEYDVLPWYRDRLPLIFIENELAMVPGFGIAEKFAAEKDEQAWRISWQGNVLYRLPALNSI